MQFSITSQDWLKDEINSELLNMMERRIAVGGLIDGYLKLVAGDDNLSAKFSHSIA